MDIETARYLAGKSQEMLNKQIDSYRQKQANAATIIGINALFIPFFLGGLKDSLIYIQLLSIIPVIGISVALFFLLSIYAMNPLQQGLALKGYDEAINKTFENAILFEIGVNRDSFDNNTSILKKKDKSYRRGVYLTMIAIFASIILLIVNLVIEQKKDSTTLEITKYSVEISTKNDSLIIENHKKIIIPSNNIKQKSKNENKQ